MPDADRVLTLYILTGPQANRIGLFRFSLALALDDLAEEADDGITRRWAGSDERIGLRVREAFDRVCAAFQWHYDGDARVLWIPSWWDFNLPANPNVLEAALADVDELPDTELVDRFAENVRYLPDEYQPATVKGGRKSNAGEPETFRARFARCMAKRLAKRSGKRSG
jgi:hypothetical protein